MTSARRRDRGQPGVHRAVLPGAVRQPLELCWVPLSKDLLALDGPRDWVVLYRELLRIVVLASQADHALLVEVDATAVSAGRPVFNVYPEPASEGEGRLWAYAAGYIASAVREGDEARLPRDLKDALDIGSMVVVPVLVESGSCAAVAVFRGTSSPPFGPEASQLLQGLADQVPDVVRRATHDAEIRPRASRFMRLVQALGALRTAGRLCCLLDAAVLLLGRAGAGEAAVFRVFNPELGELEVVASSGRPRSPKATDPVPASRCRAITGLASSGMGRGVGGVGVSGRGEWPRCPLLCSHKRHADDGVFCVPVRCGRDVVGVLELWMPLGEMPGEGDVRLVEAVATAIGRAFAEAGVVGGTTFESGPETDLVEKFAVVSKTSSDPAHVAKVLLTLLRAAVPFDVGAIAERLGDIDAREFAVLQSCSFPAAPGRANGGPEHHEAPGGTVGSRASAPRGGIPQAVADGPDAEAWTRQVLQRAGMFGNAVGMRRLYLPHTRWQVGLVVPLTSAGSVGAVLVLGRTAADPFSQDELECLDGVREAIAELWENMALRTRPLADTAQEAMAERIATLEQLAAGAAHEIKNPLSVMKGYLQVMQSDESASEAIKNRIDRLLRQIEQIGAVVEEFAQIAKPLTGELAPLSVTGLLEEVLEVIEPQASNIGITIVRAYAEDTPEVMGDGGKLEQVFLNLCRNSLEAMAPLGGGELRVSTRTAEDGRFVEVEFRDTGPGMSAEIMSRIFRPFFTTKKHGTGLGLTISMQIVRQHGGTIRVESSPGAGATFTVVLPTAPR